MPHSVLIYEDNEDLANSIKLLFKMQSEYELITVLPNAQTILEDIDEFKPTIILLDIEMPGISGVQALKLLRTIYKELPVLMFTVFDDDDNIFESICLGASGYLLKNDIEKLVPAITELFNGGAPMSSSIAKKVLQLFALPRSRTTLKSAAVSDLTKRETELLNLLVKGYSYKMIAAELHIALETVRAHIKKIYKKLHVNSATEALYKVLNK